jgi:hypothetical protein
MDDASLSWSEFSDLQPDRAIQAPIFRAHTHSEKRQGASPGVCNFKDVIAVRVDP